LNLAFDITLASFDFYEFPDQKINYYTLMLDAEGRFFRNSWLSVYLGLGVGFLQIQDQSYWDSWGEYWVDLGNETVTTMAIELGFKMPLMRNNKLLARLGLRIYGEVSPDYDNYVWSEWSEDWEPGTDFERINTQFLFGLEFHF
jgi:hypothetical protein